MQPCHKILCLLAYNSNLEASATKAIGSIPVTGITRYSEEYRRLVCEVLEFYCMNRDKTNPLLNAYARALAYVKGTWSDLGSFTSRANAQDRKLAVYFYINLSFSFLSTSSSSKADSSFALTKPSTSHQTHVPILSTKAQPAITMLLKNLTTPLILLTTLVTPAMARKTDGGAATCGAPECNTCDHKGCPGTAKRSIIMRFMARDDFPDILSAVSSYTIGEAGPDPLAASDAGLPTTET